MLCQTCYQRTLMGINEWPRRGRKIFGDFMKALLFFFVLSVLAQNTPASVEGVTRAYNGCMTFLKMSKEEQIEIARRSGHSFEQTILACKVMKRNGLKKSIYYERVYGRNQIAQRNRPSGSPQNHVRSPHDVGICYPAPNCNGTGYETYRFRCSGISSFKARQSVRCDN